jgi:hypothetical protein
VSCQRRRTTIHENSCCLIRLPERAVKVLTNKSPASFQFFFTKTEKRVELKRKNLGDLLRVYRQDSEVNSIVSYRVSKIVDTLIEINHVEIMKAVIYMGIEEKLLRHFYDESTSLEIFYNVFINIRGSGDTSSEIFDSPKKPKSPCLEASNCQDKAQNEGRTKALPSESLSLAARVMKENSPISKPQAPLLFLVGDEEVIKDFSKKKTNKSLNVSNYMESEKSNHNYLHSIWDYRLGVIRRLVEHISQATDELTASNGLAVIVKMLNEGRDILDFAQFVIHLFYKENHLMTIYLRVKASSSDGTFARSIDVFVALLNLHQELFAGKSCEDKGIKLGAQFYGKYVDIIEGLKEELAQVT